MGRRREQSLNTLGAGGSSQHSSTNSPQGHAKFALPFIKHMALTNAQKQRRFGDRNVIVLTDRAEQIAEKLIDMEDQKKLRRIAKLIGNYLKNFPIGAASGPWTSATWAMDGWQQITPLSVPIELTSPAFSGAFFEHVLNDAAHG